MKGLGLDGHDLLHGAEVVDEIEAATGADPRPPRSPVVARQRQRAARPSSHHRGMDPKALDKLLLSLLDRDSNMNFDLELTDPIPWEGDPSLSSREADLLLQEGKHQGLLEGERGEGDGSMSWWSNVCLTVDGLRQFGEWLRRGENIFPAPGTTGCGASEIALSLTSSPQSLLTPASYTALRAGTAHRSAIAGGRSCDSCRPASPPAGCNRAVSTAFV